MAHKKGLGSSRNGRDSNAKRLGVKVFAGQAVTGGEPERLLGADRADLLAGQAGVERRAQLEGR